MIIVYLGLLCAFSSFAVLTPAGAEPKDMRQTWAFRKGRDRCVHIGFEPSWLAHWQ
jgi:hypothetical protein